MNPRVLILLLLSPVAAASDWQLRLEPNVGLQVTCRHVPVLTMRYHFWGKNWSYASADLQLADDRTFTGAVSDLGITIQGRMEAVAPNELRIIYRLTMKQALDGIVGGGPQFDLKLDSPALRGARDPILLEGRRGWRWPIGDDALEVRFMSPAAATYFEKDQKHRIRTYFVGEAVKRGRQTIVMTIKLPRGGTIAPTLAERYGPANDHDWPISPIDVNAAPVDLRYLNEDDRPAGRRGFVRAEGDQLVFADGTPARFWGTNIAAYALFAPKEQIQQQAQRIAALGFNLVRLHHHDSTQWVSPTVIDMARADSQLLDEQAMDRLHWWIKCLKDEGVYVWIDLHVGRQFKRGDNIGPGFNELHRQNEGEAKGFMYFNPRVRDLMKQFNTDYLNHQSPYGGKAIKDDPAVIGLLVTNENDLTRHFGHLFHPEKGHPHHQQVYEQAMQAFGAQRGLSVEKMRVTWEPGPGLIFLNDMEHRFNREMLAHLSKLGVRAPVSTTNMWGNMNVVSLPSLTDGGVIDAHTYGGEESLSANPRFAPNFLTWVATAQVHGKPLTITEWNVPYPNRDRFVGPMYMASIACLQGWDAPMHYNYSQREFSHQTRAYKWSSFSDPAITALMPAAALAYRRGDIAAAKHHVCLQLGEKQLFHEDIGPPTSATIRTLVERSRLTIGLPDASHLDWDAATEVRDARIVTDPHRDLTESKGHYIESDTGELRRDWVKGIQSIDTPRTAAAQGWLGGEAIALTNLTVALTTPKAAVVATSLDGKSIRQSGRVLLTAAARATPSSTGRLPYRCEPVAGAIAIRCDVEGMRLYALRGNGERREPMDPDYSGGAYRFELPAPRASLWYLLTNE